MKRNFLYVLRLDAESLCSTHEAERDIIFDFCRKYEEDNESTNEITAFLKDIHSLFHDIDLYRNDEDEEWYPIDTIRKALDSTLPPL